MGHVFTHTLATTSADDVSTVLIRNHYEYKIETKTAKKVRKYPYIASRPGFIAFRPASF